ncbi:MAG TPA: hypothetical protein VLB83_00465 [Candidatus Paceibacterota bacterium]|nr:hypothetical protein [Candidatus Paceibacterota bacterium]
MVKVIDFILKVVMFPITFLMEEIIGVGKKKPENGGGPQQKI